MKETFLRTPYNYDRNIASDQSGLECNDPTLTKQSFKEECDINTIVERFNITGELPQNVRMPEYRDFTEITDYHTALNAIAQARESFDAMPANIRARFQNDPEQFVDFCNDPGNRDEAKKMGLLVPAPPQEPAPTPPQQVAMGYDPNKAEPLQGVRPKGDTNNQNSVT